MQYIDSGEWKDEPITLCTTYYENCCHSAHFGEGNGNPLQYSWLANPMDGGAWWAAVHGVARSRTQLSDFTFTFHFHALEKEMATHSQENPRDGGAWWAAISGVAQSQTRLKRLSSSSSSSCTFRLGMSHYDTSHIFWPKIFPGPFAVYHVDKWNRTGEKVFGTKECSWIRNICQQVSVIFLGLFLGLNNVCSRHLNNACLQVSIMSISRS